MENLLNAVLDKLSGIPEIEFVDIDLEQLQLPDPPVSFPCALVDIAQEDYSSNTGGQQMTETTVNVTLGFRVYGPSDTKSDPKDRARSMAHYAILRKVSDTLHGFEGPTFSPLSRAKLVRRAMTYPRHFTLTFRTQRREEGKPKPVMRKPFQRPNPEQP